LLIFVAAGFLISFISRIDRFALLKKECQVTVEKRIVRGNSLAPLIKEGQEIKAFFGYYKCNEVKRGDVVLYSYAGNEVPLIKIVKGIPGDSFKLKEVEEVEQDKWQILINGEVLKNSEGIPYVVSGKRYEMLSIYERSYKSKIPEDAYLLLGDLPSGTTDSTRFGLIGKQDIPGKVEY